MTKINDNISRLILSVSKAEYFFLIEEDKGNVSVLHAIGSLDISQQDLEKLTLEVIKDHSNLTSSEVFNEFKNNYSLSDIYVNKINYLDTLLKNNKSKKLNTLKKNFKKSTILERNFWESFV